MDGSIINFKRFESGALVGFFDLAVVRPGRHGCKAFEKATSSGSGGHPRRSMTEVKMLNGAT